MEHNDVGYLLNRATRQFRLDLGEALRGIGLRPQQAAVIMAIAREKQEGLTPRAVADSVDTDAATTSGLLARLARDGWVTSQPHPTDGRSRLFVLTDKAKRTLPQVIGLADTASAQATRHLTSEELGSLRQLLLKLCDPDGSTEAAP